MKLNGNVGAPFTFDTAIGELSTDELIRMICIQTGMNHCQLERYSGISHPSLHPSRGNPGIKVVALLLLSTGYEITIRRPPP